MPIPIPPCRNTKTNPEEHEIKGFFSCEVQVAIAASWPIHQFIFSFNKMMEIC